MNSELRVAKCEVRSAKCEVRLAPRASRLTPHVSRFTFHASRLPHCSLFIVSLFIVSSFIASCVPAGVSDLSSRSGQIAIINKDDLYVVSATGPNITYYASRPDKDFTPLLTPDGKSVVYVEQFRRLVRKPLDGGPVKELLRVAGFPGPGAMTFLPNGELFFLDTRSNGKRYFVILNADTGVISQQVEDIDQVFVTANSLKLKTSAPGAPPTAARLVADTPGRFKMVFQAGQYYYLYSAEADGLVFNGARPRVVGQQDQILLANRVDNDVTSGLLTPDGDYLILREKTGIPAGSAQSLLAIDLTSDAAPVVLLKDIPASQPIHYAVAPAGDRVAFEEVVNGQPQIRIYDLSTGQSATLGPGAIEPEWWK